MANQQRSEYSHDKRDPVDFGLVGNLHAQPEHSKNALLAKAGLGQVKHTVYDLPSAKNFQHSYGLSYNRDAFGCDKILGDWHVSQGTADLQPGRDFKQLNAESAVVGLTTAKGFTNYRLSHDARLKQASSRVVLPVPYDKTTTTFGRPTDQDTPMGDLISHGYRYDWAVANQGAAQELIAAKGSKKPKQTRTSILQAQTSHAKVAALNEKELLEQLHLDKTAPPDGRWKMTAFKVVPPKVGYTGE